MLRFLLSFLVCIACSTALAQPRLSNLQSELAAGRLKLLSIAGTGGSSGTVITAQLFNATTVPIRLETYLNEPIHFTNSGSNQNMIASQVLLDGGSYLSDGRRSFIVIPPKANAKVVFLAYCLDFEKYNPTSADTFSIGSSSPQLVGVLYNVRNYLRTNPKADVVVATQAAIWLKQGVSLSNIREKFSVSEEEAQLAQRFIK